MKTIQPFAHSDGVHEIEIQLCDDEKDSILITTPHGSWEVQPFKVCVAVYRCDPLSRTRSGRFRTRMYSTYIRDFADAFRFVALLMSMDCPCGPEARAMGLVRP